MARMARRSAVAIAARSAHAGWTHPTIARLRGGVVAVLGIGLICAFATYRVTDPSLDAASGLRAHNILGGVGADAAFHEALGVSYRHNDVAIATAHAMVAELMTGLGYVEAGSKDLPNRYVARSGVFWKRK